MKSLSSLMGLFVILLLSATSYAQSVCPHCGRIHQMSFAPNPAATYINNAFATFPISTASAAPATTTMSPARSFTGGGAQGLAQQKANLAASTMNRGHVGGSLGSATHEGVGFSTESAQQAIDAACYSGSPISAQGPGRPRIGTGVARGSDGWYSCLLCL